MFCTECGTKAVGAGKFCASCGAKLTQTEALVMKANISTITTDRLANNSEHTSEKKAPWFEINSPFEGVVATPAEYYKAIDRACVKQGDMTQEEAAESAANHDEHFQDGLYSDIFAVLPSVGIVKAPFDGTIGDDSTLSEMIICAQNGVTVRVMNVYSNAVADSIESTIAREDRVKKGDVLYTFDISKLPPKSPIAIKIDSWCFNAESLDTPTYTFTDRKTVSFEDAVISVEADHPAPPKMVEAMIAGFAAQWAITQAGFSSITEGFREISEAWEEQDAQIDELAQDFKSIASFQTFLNDLANYRNTYTDMMNKFDRLISDKNYSGAITTLDKLISDHEQMLADINEYEANNSDDGFDERRRSIRDGINKQIESFFSMKKSAGLAAADSEARNSFWNAIKKSPGKAFRDMSLYVIRTMNDE